MIGGNRRKLLQTVDDSFNELYETKQNKVWYSDAEPTSEESEDGDIWFDIAKKKVISQYPTQGLEFYKFSSTGAIFSHYIPKYLENYINLPTEEREPYYQYFYIDTGILDPYNKPIYMWFDLNFIDSASAVPISFTHLGNNFTMEMRRIFSSDQNKDFDEANMTYIANSAVYHMNEYKVDMEFSADGIESPYAISIPFSEAFAQNSNALKNGYTIPYNDFAQYLNQPYMMVKISINKF